MAIKKIQKNRMNDAGTFDVIHYETDASQVLMADGTTAEAAITGKEAAGAAAQALVDAKSYTDTKIADIPTPDVSGQINTHNTDANAHSVLFEAKADLVNGVVPVSQLPNEVKECRIVADIAARDAITDKFAGLNVYVKDANADPTVDSGGAYYLYDDTGWIKTGEAESMDAVQSWANITDKPTEFTPSEHTHEQADVAGLESALAAKQDAITGTQGQVVGFGDDGRPVAQDAPSVPTKTSQLQNDSGFMTSYTETDPTVPDWAKQPAKPTYTASEVGALPDTTSIPTALSDLSDDATHRVVTDAEKTAWSAKADKPKSILVTLTAAGWTYNGDNRYKQTVNVEGVTTDASQIIVVDVYQDGTDLDADATVLEAWLDASGPAGQNKTQGNGTLTFYALSVPSVNIPVNVGVC